MLMCENLFTHKVSGSNFNQVKNPMEGRLFWPPDFAAEPLFGQRAQIGIMELIKGFCSLN